jgi:hypothetical protein
VADRFQLSDCSELCVIHHDVYSREGVEMMALKILSFPFIFLSFNVFSLTRFFRVSFHIACHVFRDRI